MPELQDQRIISHEMHVTSANMGYDVIIGMDVITSLGITICGENFTIKWADGEIPLRSRDSTAQDAFLINDPVLV